MVRVGFIRAGSGPADPHTNASPGLVHALQVLNLTQALFLVK